MYHIDAHLSGRDMNVGLVAAKTFPKGLSIAASDLIDDSHITANFPKSGRVAINVKVGSTADLNLQRLVDVHRGFHVQKPMYDFESILIEAVYANGDRATFLRCTDLRFTAKSVGDTIYRQYAFMYEDAAVGRATNRKITA